MVYTPKNFPNTTSIDDIRRFLEQELQSIALEGNETTETYYRAVNREPTKPREGLLVYADGTNWNPSVGNGPYIYRNGVWVPLLPGLGAPREVLTTNRTYYVRSDGNDANSGLVDSAAGAFLTIQKACNFVAGRLDFNTFTVTIQVRTGTYAGFGVFPWIGGGTLIINGDLVTASNVVLNSAAFSGGAAITTLGALPGALGLQGFKIAGTGFFGLRVVTAAAVVTTNWEWGALVGGVPHMFVANGGTIQISGNYTISGGASQHMQVGNSGQISKAGAITATLTGTPNFATAFAQADHGGNLAVPGMIYSGAATGKRYYATLNGIIDTGSGGANFFPGNVIGTFDTGGQYV